MHNADSESDSEQVPSRLVRRLVLIPLPQVLEHSDQFSQLEQVSSFWQRFPSQAVGMSLLMLDIVMVVVLSAIAVVAVVVLGVDVVRVTLVVLGVDVV